MLHRTLPVTELHAFYAAIVECSDALIVAKDPEGRVVVWNAAAERLLGYKAQDLRGRSVQALLPPDRLHEDDAVLARLRSGERVPPFLTKRRHKSGHLVDLAISASPMFDHLGALIGVSYIARDPGTYLEQQRLLSESEQRFRMLADNIAQFAWIARPDGRVEWFNRSSYEYSGMTPEELTGYGWHKTLHPDHAERVLTSFQAALAEETPWEEIHPIRGKDGQYRWFLARANPVRDAHGGTVWIGTNTDITDERERTEQVRLLLMEVNHRSKNLLSTVQALVRRSAPGDDGFVTRFEERIHSLAINQDILVRREWREVPLAELAAEQLAFVEGALGEVRISGVSCLLVPRAAEVLGMALHELATNSLKYGALSARGGVVDVGWNCATDSRTFEIWWRERNGPPVILPTRHGFGTTLIRDVPQHHLAGEVVLEYKPEGMCWSLRCDEFVLVHPVGASDG